MSAGRPRRRRGAPRALRPVQSTGPTPPRPRRPSRQCARPPPLRRLRRVRRRGASRRDRRLRARRTGAAARAPGGRRRRALRARRRTLTTTGWATCSLVRPVPVQARGAGTGVRGEAERPACGRMPGDTTGHQLGGLCADAPLVTCCGAAPSTWQPGCRVRASAAPLYAAATPACRLDAAAAACNARGAVSKTRSLSQAGTPAVDR